MKSRYIKVPPELNDGEASAVYSLTELATHNGSLGELIAMWAGHENECADSELGDKVTLEIVELTDEEFEAMEQ